MRHTPSGDFQTNKSWSWLSSAVIVVPDDVLMRLYRRRRDPPLQVREARHARDDGQELLVAWFGGIELRWQKTVIFNDQPKQVYSHRSEVVQRVLAQTCERYGSMGNCEVHHVRELADLSTPGRREKPLWVRRMAARRRKTLATC
jgi:hypothetical protein